VSGQDGSESPGGTPAPAALVERAMPVALDVDGIAVVTLGTVLWGIALVVALVLHDPLRRHGHTWWIAAAACGFGLGLLGIGYCRRRISRRV
jgi:hypothetical protein